ncbi:DUF397 domain-containing protein [Streptomyces sp. NPDC002845]
MVGRESSGRVWVRSSHSGDQGECVEVAAEEGLVLIRDSNRSKDTVLVFRQASWCGFLAELVNPGAGGS